MSIFTVHRIDHWLVYNESKKLASMSIKGIYNFKNIIVVVEVGTHTHTHNVGIY